ncbi:MAG: hypothetical protein M3275_07495 [Thermoproteota archaeon]|nr:hypothetical protein [Thermoproteota archaeon]
MAYIPNKLVIFGAVAAAALVVPGILGPLMFQEAEATHRQGHSDNSQNAVNRAGDNLLNVQANAQVIVNDVTACIIVEDC